MSGFAEENQRSLRGIAHASDPKLLCMGLFSIFWVREPAGHPTRSANAEPELIGKPDKTDNPVDELMITKPNGVLDIAVDTGELVLIGGINDARSGRQV